MIAQPDVTVPPNIRRLEDGRLVLVGGNHGVAQMFERGSSTVPEERIEIFRRNHRTRKQWADENGCTYSQWVFPDPIVLNAVTAGLGYRSIFERSMPSDARPNDLLYPIDHLFGQNDRLPSARRHRWPGDFSRAVAPGLKAGSTTALPATSAGLCRWTAC